MKKMNKIEMVKRHRKQFGYIDEVDRERQNPIIRIETNRTPEEWQEIVKEAHKREGKSYLELPRK